MTNLERTKAVVARERLGLEVMQQHGLSPGPSVPWILLNEAESLVAAVERVQAIAEHWSTCPKGDYDCHDCNYYRPEAGDLLLEALKLETP